MSSSSFQNVARTVGGELAKQGILMAKEVPGSVAAAIGIAGFMSWSYLAMRGANPALKRQNRLSWLAKKSITGGKAQSEDASNSDGPAAVMRTFLKMRKRTCSIFARRKWLKEMSMKSSRL
mmetsp:Transcript_346/g.727  ORF Transcript_346/g.727 Transcript_346/m.727 type:complete len:121 (-) Transcript_346:841-1203(-)